jgi:hypothetical protein
MPDVEPISRARRFNAANRYGLVLALIVVTYVQSVTTDSRHLGTEWVILLQLATVYLVFGASGSPRIRRVAGLALVAAGLMTVAGATIGASTDSEAILQVLYLVNILLYAVAPLVILRHIFVRTVVDGETMVAAVCAYLLIGMMFAFTYRAIGSMDSTTPFFGDAGTGSMSQDLFFSFITMTTVGYGNLVPAGELGQSLAVLEALLGQLFLAAAVAKVVTVWRPRAQRDATAEGPDPA